MHTEIMSALPIALQCLHLLFAVVWLGTLIDSELFLWPLLARLNAMNVQDELRSKRERRKTGVIILGTLSLGICAARSMASSIGSSPFTVCCTCRRQWSPQRSSYGGSASRRGTGPLAGACTTRVSPSSSG